MLEACEDTNKCQTILPHTYAKHIFVGQVLGLRIVCAFLNLHFLCLPATLFGKQCSNNTFVCFFVSNGVFVVCVCLRVCVNGIVCVCVCVCVCVYKWAIIGITVVT